MLFTVLLLSVWRIICLMDYIDSTENLIKHSYYQA